MFFRRQCQHWSAQISSYSTNNAPSNLPSPRQMKSQHALCLQLSSKVIATNCVRRQQVHLRAFAKAFPDAINGNFVQAHPELLQSFRTLVSGMQVQARLTLLLMQRLHTSGCLPSSLLPKQHRLHFFQEAIAILAGKGMPRSTYYIPQ